MVVLRASAVVLTLALFWLVGAPVQRLALARRWRLAERLPRFFHRTMCRLLRVHVRFHGRFTRVTPLLIVTNHVSWIDILALSTDLPVSFLAKREVASWPLFGTFARLQRSVFVDRQRRSDLPKVNDEIAARLRAGNPIVLFAESTTSDGTGLLRFRGAHFGVAQTFLQSPDDPALTVQPAAVTYRTDRRATVLAWYGDMDLVPHLWSVIKGGPYACDVYVGDPIRLGRDTTRKAATRITEDAVRRLLNDARC